MKRFCLLILLSCIATAAFAKGYKISLEVKGMRDSTVKLAVYSGSSRFAVDSAVLDVKGRAVFSKAESLDAGMYLIVLNKTILFDLLISDEKSQTFSIQTNAGSTLDKPVFSGSPENEAFVAYQQYKKVNMDVQEKLNQTMMQTRDDAKLDSLNAESRKLRTGLAHYSDSVARRNEGKTIAVVIDALNVPEPPQLDIPRDNPKRDSIIFMAYYGFVKDHFFDRMNLADDRLARTPFFESMLIYYVDKLLLYQQADSIIPYVDRIIDKSESSKLMFRYNLSNLFNHYMQSKVMGLEAVAVHLAERYYLAGKTDWETEKFAKNITDFVNRTKPTLLGKTAPNLVMETLDGRRESIASIDAPFLIVYFYEPSCGHCKKETPQVHKVYQKYKDRGVQVFAVYTQQDKAEWLSYIAEQGLDWINVWDPSNLNNFRELYNVYITPQLYLLDKNKRVIGRRLDPENLEKMLRDLTK